MTNVEESLKVDVGQVIKSQKAFLLRKMPGFMIRIIEKVIHQKELNEMLLLLKDKFGVDFVHGLSDYFDVKTEVYGEENLPNHNHLIFTVNHSMGAMEGIGSYLFLQKKYLDIKVLANNILMNLKNVTSILLPVNTFGKTGRDAMMKIAETYMSDTNIYTFPSGEVSRIIDGKVKDSNWHKSFVENAVNYKRTVVPIFIENINSKSFYRIYKFRKFFGIKLNIELFLLPHELFSHKGTVIKFKIGKPIPYTVFTDKYTSFEWAQKVKNHVYKFKEDYNVVFDE
jgi:hypothetical protein